MNTEPLTGFELGVIAIALLKLKEHQRNNKPVQAALLSIAGKLGLEKTLQEGGAGWKQFQRALTSPPEGGAA